MATHGNASSQESSAPLVDFDRFLKVAKEKPFPQKLLLVFAEKEFRDDGKNTHDEFARTADFSVNPVMYVDKSLDEITDFDHLQKDSLSNGQPWDLVFVAAVDISKITAEIIDQRLQFMVKLIQQGESERFLIFNVEGEISHLSQTVAQ